MDNKKLNEEKYAYLQDVFGMLLDNTLGKGSKKGSPLKGKYCSGIYEGVIPAQPFYNYFKKNYQPKPYFSHTAVAYFLTMAHRERQRNKAAYLLRLRPSEEHIKRPLLCQWNKDIPDSKDPKSKLGKCFAHFVESGKFPCSDKANCIMKSVYKRLQQIEELYPEKKLNILEETVFDIKKERQKYETLSKEYESFDGKLTESLMETSLNVIKLANLEDINLIKLKFLATRIIFYFPNITLRRYSGCEETCYETLNELLDIMRVYNFDRTYKDLYIDILLDTIVSFVTLQELQTSTKIGTYKRISAACKSCIERLNLSAEQQLKVYIEWWLLSIKNTDTETAKELELKINELKEQADFPEIISRHALYKVVTGIESICDAEQTISECSVKLRANERYSDAQELLTDILYVVYGKTCGIENTPRHLYFLKACSGKFNYEFSDISKIPRIFYDFMIEDFILSPATTDFVVDNYLRKYKKIIR